MPDASRPFMPIDEKPPASLVLVAEDNDDLRTLFERALRRAGFDTVSATDGLEAERIIAERMPAVVVLDLVMPGIDGLELLRSLPRDRPRPAVVVVSGYEDLTGTSTYIKAAAAFGADKVLQKPLLPSDLVAAVADLMATVHPDRSAS